MGKAKIGVFYVQGTVSVQGSALFAASGRYWFKVRDDGAPSRMAHTASKEICRYVGEER